MTNETQTERKAANLKAVTKYQQTPKGKAGIAKYHKSTKYRAYQAKYNKTPKGRAAKRKAVAKHQARNPNYVKANHAVNNAVAAGLLPRANTRLCYYCPKPAQQWHHWHGYEPEHWLDVVPVCVECHTKIHKKIA